MTLGVPSAFTREWVEKRHAPLIKSLLEEIFDKDVRLRFVLTPREKGEQAAAQPAAFPPAGEEARAAPPAGARAAAAGDQFPRTPVRRGGAAPRPPAPARNVRDTPPPSRRRPPPPRRPGAPPPSPARAAGPSRDAPPLNERYTFDVRGRAVQPARAGRGAGRGPGPGAAFNPLFLYRPSGLGKTHLMHAISNEIAERRGRGRAHRLHLGRIVHLITSRPCASSGPTSSAASGAPWTCGSWTTSSSSPARSTPRRSSSTPSTPCTRPANRS